jgi:multiple antibiotic resistance protein
LISFVINILVSWVVFLLSNWIVRFIRIGGLKAVSKVFSLLLAAIAVSMIFRGLELINVM